MSSPDARADAGTGLGKTRALKPMQCRCGEDLVIACPKGCADVDPPFDRTKVDPIALTRPPRESADDAPTRARAKLTGICERCGKIIPRGLGRVPRYHDTCRTPAEMAALLKLRRFNQQNREIASA